MEDNKKRKVKVTRATQSFVEFENDYFKPGDLLQDVNDDDHDIELEARVGSSPTTFRYLGTAKIGEEYFMKESKTPEFKWLSKEEWDKEKVFNTMRERGIRPVLINPPMTPEETKKFQEAWMAAMPKINEVNWESSPPIIYGTAGEIPLGIEEVEKKFNKDTTNMEKLKAYQELYRQLWIKIEALLAKNNNLKE